MDHGDIGYLLNRATRQFRLDLGAALGEVGLRPQQAAVLMAIARSARGQLTPSEIAEAVDADAATTSGVLERLARDGWVASGPNPGDGRSRLFALTDNSNRALPQVMAIAHEVSANATQCLTSEERDALRQLLQRLCRDDRGVEGGAR